MCWENKRTEMLFSEEGSMDLRVIKYHISSADVVLAEQTPGQSILSLLIFAS